MQNIFVFRNTVRHFPHQGSAGGGGQGGQMPPLMVSS